MSERCFALRVNGKCSAQKGGCTGRAGCAFFKTVRQLKEEQRRVNARLSGLPLEEQLYIADKYFGGTMPWRGENE